jgi:cell division protein FtsZ
MISNSEFGNISFDLPKNQSNVIKVIGVGGGGSNAINHMFKQGINGVDFIVCNTDSQALQNSPVPNKIQLGVNLTEGLGAGANPDVGQQSALESVGDIEKMLDTNTKMVFITAGMGGGTGTGAAPVIAQMAKERGILTVGIVTCPFQFEGKVRQDQAKLGVEKLRKQVDSLIVINNNKLREVYGNLGFKAGFSKADEVLATASRGIAEVITHHYTQNIDLKDAKTVLENSGRAIMGSASASGENRAKEAIIAALDSPLLDDNKISGAKNVLLLIVSGSNEITIDEIGEINDHIQSEAGHNANIIMGVGEDENLGESIAVTIIATGFNEEQQNGILSIEAKKIIHSLDGEHKLERDLTQKPVEVFQTKIESPIEFNEEKIIFELIEEEIESTEGEFVQQIANVVSDISENELIAMNQFIRNLDVTFEIVSPINDIDFNVATPEALEMKDVEPKSIEVEEQIPLLLTCLLSNLKL